MNPTIAPELATPAHMPIALLRSFLGKAAVSNDNVAGMMNAAPTPATARATMICIGLSKIVGANEAMAKIARPTSNAPRRPYRSPSAPAGNSKQASTSVYPSTTQVSCVCVAAVCSAMSGSAALSATIEEITSRTSTAATVNNQNRPNFDRDGQVGVDILIGPGEGVDHDRHSLSIEYF